MFIIFLTNDEQDEGATSNMHNQGDNDAFWYSIIQGPACKNEFKLFEDSHNFFVYVVGVHVLYSLEPSALHS